MLDLSSVVAILKGKGPRVPGPFPSKKTLESKGVGTSVGSEYVT